MSDIILSSPLYSSVPSIPIEVPVIRVAFILYQPILVSSYSKVQSGNVVTLILYSSGFVNLLPTVRVYDLWRFSKHFLVGLHQIYLKVQSLNLSLSPP